MAMPEGMDGVTIYMVGGGILLTYGAWDLARSGFTGSTAYWMEWGLEKQHRIKDTNANWRFCYTDERGGFDGRDWAVVLG